LPLEDRDILSMAIYEYALDWKEPKLEWAINLMFELIRPQIDANNKRFVDGKKWWAPKWNSNAKKEREKIELASDLANQYKTTSGWFENNQWSNEKQPNVNVNDNVNDNVNENNNENENDSIALDANASRGNIEKKVGIAKKNKWDVDGKTLSKQDAINRLRQRMIDEWYSDTVVNLIMDFDEVKKWTKLHKQAEKSLKSFITTLNTRDTEQWKIDLLNTAISWPTQWIWPNKYRKQTVVKPRVSWNMFH
jgi:hypothetical protein